MNTIQAIHSRHSYRGKYKKTPVPREDLIRILQAGLAAPSGCNKQTTSLIAVDDPLVLERLHSVIQPPVGETAPAAICVLTRRIFAYRDKCFAIQDYSAAIQNMLLAMTDMGYQSCWYEGHITDDDRICDRMAEILNVPDGYEVVCFLPVGIAESATNPAKKKSFEERAWFNSFPCKTGDPVENS
ncbi:MAG: nitroreductase family protein [Oscillospiraceae bacterium]|nr:nitroreductase family protein [Oscillospiraceae bacterium]